jgi:hypothetical protein
LAILLQVVRSTVTPEVQYDPEMAHHAKAARDPVADI